MTPSLNRILFLLVFVSLISCEKDLLEQPVIPEKPNVTTVLPTNNFQRFFNIGAGERNSQGVKVT